MPALWAFTSEVKMHIPTVTATSRFNPFPTIRPVFTVISGQSKGVTCYNSFLNLKNSLQETYLFGSIAYDERGAMPLHLITAVPHPCRHRVMLSAPNTEGV